MFDKAKLLRGAWESIEEEILGDCIADVEAETGEMVKAKGDEEEECRLEVVRAVRSMKMFFLTIRDAVLCFALRSVCCISLA